MAQSDEILVKTSELGGVILTSYWSGLIYSVPWRRPPRDTTPVKQEEKKSLRFAIPSKLKHTAISRATHPQPTLHPSDSSPTFQVKEEHTMLGTHNPPHTQQERSRKLCIRSYAPVCSIILVFPLCCFMNEYDLQHVLPFPLPPPLPAQQTLSAAQARKHHGEGAPMPTGGRPTSSRSSSCSVTSSRGGHPAGAGRVRGCAATKPG